MGATFHDGGSSSPSISPTPNAAAMFLAVSSDSRQESLYLRWTFT
ncbi:hypothetical protein [Amycolatopsis thailandensis]